MADEAPGDRDAGKKPDGISAFIANVLDQLSTTAWLPAAMLVGVGSLLVQLHQNGNLNVAQAVQDLATKPWGVIIILVFGLVLTTMVTQAFSFGAIRVLEGYWGPGRLVERFLSRSVSREVRTWEGVEDRVRLLDQELFESARARLLAEEDRDHIDVWEAQVYQTPRATRRQQDPAIINAANAIEWREKADPGKAAVLYRLHMRLSDFPSAPHRFLPMRLGNILRAAEEQLGERGAALERFVLRNYAKVPSRLMAQHDQFRNRLDMYCVLAVVFILLGLGSVPLLLGTISVAWWAAPLGGLLLFVALAWVSYRAAIASARGYGATLVAMKESLPPIPLATSAGAAAS